MKSRIVVAAAVAGLFVVGCAQASENSARRGAKSQTPPATPAIEAAPPVPPTLEQMPAVAPQVTYSEGQLTVKAQNSTLADILKAIHTQTGAQIDVPGNAAERVVGQFGPGPARDVLSQLLNGSHFNYVLLGSEANPFGLDKVILLAKSGAPVDSSPVEQANNNINPATPNPALAANGLMGRPMPGRFAPPNQNAPNQQTVEGEDPAADDSADATDDSTDDNTDTADDQSDQATDDQQGDQAAAEGDQQQPGQQQGVKTPEQLLQELQQQQQQQQQGVQQANPQGLPPGMPSGLQPHN